MLVAEKTLRRKASTTPRRVAGIRSSVELLEGRTLLSWGPAADDFQVYPGAETDVQDIAADAAGNLYGAFYVFDNAGVVHAVVGQKLSGQSTWTTLLDLPDSPATQGVEAQFSSIAVRPAAGGLYDLYVAGIGTNGGVYGAFVLERHAGQTSFDSVDWLPRGSYFTGELATDAAGDVFVTGSVLQDSTQGPIKTHSHWIVRKQSGGAGAFNTIDLMAENDTRAIAVTTVGSNTIYVTGYGSGTGTGRVRKSTDGGATWTQVDTWNNSDPGGPRAPIPQGITADASGNVYAAGIRSIRTQTGGTVKKPTYTWGAYWAVRQSTNGGASWTWVDQYELSSFKTASANDVGIDPTTGTVYVVGSADDSNGVSHNIIRSNTGPGGSWETVDNYQLAPGKPGNNAAFTTDSNGNLYVGGTAADSAGVNHAIVRSQPAAPAAFSSVLLSGASSSGGKSSSWDNFTLVDDLLGASA